MLIGFVFFSSLFFVYVNKSVNFLAYFSQSRISKRKGCKETRYYSSDVGTANSYIYFD